MIKFYWNLYILDEILSKINLYLPSTIYDLLWWFNSTFKFIFGKHKCLKSSCNILEDYEKFGHSKINIVILLSTMFKKCLQGIQNPLNFLEDFSCNLRYFHLYLWHLLTCNPSNYFPKLVFARWLLPSSVLPSSGQILCTLQNTNKNTYIWEYYKSDSNCYLPYMAFLWNYSWNNWVL